MAASETSMSITTFKEVAPKLPPSRSTLLRAGHGVGKSQVIRQVSWKVRRWLYEQQIIANLNGYPVFDIRLGQRSEGDIIGLPSTDGRVTRFNPPEWYHMCCEQPCCLFLDELNRATAEVMQAAFQIALDHELDGHKMHPHSRVYSAINTGATYQVNEIDPALLSRFFVVDLVTEPAEFVAHGRNTDTEQGGNFHFFITDFIEMNEKWLYPDKKGYDPGSQQPTPRGWEFVNEALIHANLIETPADPMFWQITRGFVGNDAASAFQAYCRTVDVQVSGQDIVDNYHKSGIKVKVDKQSHERRNGLIEKISDYVVKHCEALTQQQGNNIKAFMMLLDDEHRISLWSKLTSHGIDKIGLAKSIHKYCAGDILEVFGVPMGEAGIGIIPNIPGIFKAPAKGATK
jgi:hypothetical protein